MTSALKLLCVMAHPDDEAMGVGGMLARYASEGVETYLLTATRGEYGWSGAPEAQPDPTTLGKLREGELQAAARVLGIREVALLDYIDGVLDQADPAQVVAQIVAHVRRIQPQVVVTFGPDGIYGHPDHIAISQFTTAAVACAADPTYGRTDGLTNHAPHRVAKLYYYVLGPAQAALFQTVLGDFFFEVDGVDRRPQVWADWSLTTQIDAPDEWRRVREAITCHASQVQGGFSHVLVQPEEILAALWGVQTFYRVYSLVNGGRHRERDLFEGIREPTEGRDYVGK